MTVGQRELDALWDPADLGETESRIRDSIERTTTTTDADRLRTLRARALATAGDHEGARRLLDGITSTDLEIQARIALEHGRALKLAGDLESAMGPLRQAVDLARRAGDVFLGADALHMLAIVDTHDALRWTADGLRLLEDVTEPRTLRWRFAMHRLAGEKHLSDGDIAAGVRDLELAARAAADFGTDEQRAIAARLLAGARSEHA